MKVSFIGFTIATNPIISLEKLMSQIIMNEERKYKINTFDRLFFCNSTSDKDYYLGCLLTIKNQKAFCELEENGSADFKIIVNQLDKNKKLLDFNFFIINKKTGAGLYQYYHQSSYDQIWCMTKEKKAV